MYTLEIESVNNDFLRAAQAVIQENGLWAYSIEIGTYSTSVKLSTMSIRELKRFVDLLESEEFMRDDVLSIP
jgi:hypothetical protein